MFNCLLSLSAILKALNPILSIVGVLIAALTLGVAFYIPRRIMINQIYADLLASYRSPKMGAAILAIFHFYTIDCKKNVSNIAAVYKWKYYEQIGKKLQANKEDTIDFSKTLHFQRRLVAQFYFHMASLRYDYCFPRLPVKYMKTWFTSGETNLLSIILHMDKPAGEEFYDAGEVPQPHEYYDEAPMNELIYKLYEEVSDWE